MYRKILLRNKVASAILRILASRLFLASYNLLSVGLRKMGSITLFIALVFTIVGIGIYSNKSGILICIKLLLAITTLGSIAGSILMLRERRIRRLYTTPFDISLILLCVIFCLLISFIFSLDVQQKRLTTPLNELSPEKKSDHKQRIPGFLVFIGITLTTVIYFIIGKQAQTVPFVPEAYFEKTRINAHLSDEENGAEQLKALIEPIYRSYPTPDEAPAPYPLKKQTANGRTNLGYDITLQREIPLNNITELNTITEHLQQDIKRRLYVTGSPFQEYDTLAELLAEHPEFDEATAIQILEQSDFFTRIEEILKMEWNISDTLPSLGDIQLLEKSLQYMVAYHANKGELSTGIYYNTLALKLADKYLSTYVSLVNASMAASCLNTAMDTTQYLLTHYELSSTDKATLLDTYHTLLHTDKITAFQHILKGEYHTMTDFLHQFTVTAPDEIGIIDSTNSPMRSFTSNNIFSIRLFKPPFYDAQATKTRFAYALKELAEGIRNGKSSEKILKEVGIITENHNISKAQLRNLYNIIGDTYIMALTPRGGYTLLDRTYQQHALIIQQLQSAVTSDRVSNVSLGEPTKRPI